MMRHRLGRAIVAGVDGSDSALAAVRWAATEARRRRVALRLVNALRPVTSAVPTPLVRVRRPRFSRVALVSRGARAGWAGAGGRDCRRLKRGLSAAAVGRAGMKP
jgi:nucleotide-binding universal stress UspA family protein